MMLAEPYFHNEDAAYSFCESWLWPAGPVCPHCRGTEGRVGKLKGRSTRRGTYKCYECRRPFTVKIGTVFESSHLGLHLWLQAIYLVAFARRTTVRELQQTLGVGLKTAWVLNRRIRELVTRDDGPLAIANEHRSVVMGDSLVSGYAATADTHRMKPASARSGADSLRTLERPETGGPELDPKREYRKRRSRRRPRQPDPKQMTLF
jgi:transposase-like protein